MGEIHGGLHRSGTIARPIREATRPAPVLIEVDLPARGPVKKAMRGHHRLSGPAQLGGAESRLSARGTETAEVMARRLATPRGVGRSGRLRRRRREQRVGVAALHGILAGGRMT